MSRDFFTNLPVAEGESLPRLPADLGVILVGCQEIDIIDIAAARNIAGARAYVAGHWSDFFVTHQGALTIQTSMRAEPPQVLERGQLQRAILRTRGL